MSDRGLQRRPTLGPFKERELHSTIVDLLNDKAVNRVRPLYDYPKERSLQIRHRHNTSVSVHNSCISQDEDRPLYQLGPMMICTTVYPICLATTLVPNLDQLSLMTEEQKAKIRPRYVHCSEKMEVFGLTMNDG